jgi:hypothetical protein
MNTIDKSILEDACWDADLDPDEALRTDYSGRGMHRKSCVGLVHDSVDELIDFVTSVRQEGGYEDALRGAVQDSMARSVITYWPRWTVTEEDDD